MDDTEERLLARAIEMKAEKAKNDPRMLLFEMGAFLSDDTHRARIIAALRRDKGHGGAGWQPIETAPKDGSRFLGFQRAFGISIIHRHDAGGETKNPRHHYECWALDGPSAYPSKPTHWMPLPEPPTSDIADDGATEPK